MSRRYRSRRGIAYERRIAFPQVPTFFHVDRESLLSDGQEITLIPPNLSTQRETDVARNLFPDGVSRWGASMLDAHPPLAITLQPLLESRLARASGDDEVLLTAAGATLLRAGKDRIIEFVAEIVRLGLTPDKPSRLAAVFAYRDVQLADDFRHNENLDRAPIWRVSVPDEAVLHDGDPRHIHQAVRQHSGLLAGPPTRRQLPLVEGGPAPATGDGRLPRGLSLHHASP